MIRLSRLTDYGIILMTYFAALKGDEVLTARDLSKQAGIPLPTVSKLLKLLAKASLIAAHRGVHGGYFLLKKPKDISVIEMIDGIEGPLAMTQCSSADISHVCELAIQCPTKNPWQKINHVVRQALSDLSLADMVGHTPKAFKENVFHILN